LRQLAQGLAPAAAASFLVMIDGVVLIDKPAGPTSHDVVARVRRALPRGVKVGHAGTLDPFATGLLLVLLGRATRIQQWLMELGKEYETVARLGWTSTTGDPEGELTETGRIPPAGVTLPTGRITQRPPAYSAVRIDGRRAYALARSGVEVEVPERTVTVTRFEETWRDIEAGRAAYSIACSSGTYVRSLIADLHDAYCLELRRTAIGPYRVEDATAPPDRDDPSPWEPSIIPLGTALSQVLPTLHLDDDSARRAGHGQVLQVDPATAAGPHLLLDPASEPVCVADVTDGRAKPRVGFRA
jgi:tRNA pseudouridine55 synthase